MKKAKITTFERTLIKNSGSAQATLPADAAKKAGLKFGDPLEVQFYEGPEIELAPGFVLSNNCFIVRKGRKRTTTVVINQ